MRAPQFPSTGELELNPPAWCFATLAAQGQTGTLDFTDGGTHRRAYLVQGRPIFMQSNAEGEDVGAFLEQRGRLRLSQYEHALARAERRGSTLQAALLELGAVTPSELATAYRLLAGQLLRRSMSLECGAFVFTETDAFRGQIPQGQFDTHRLIFEGIRDGVLPPTVRRWFRGRERARLEPTPRWSDLMSSFLRVFTHAQPEGSIGLSFAQLTLSEPSRRALELYALTVVGLMRFRDDAPVRPAQPAPKSEVERAWSTGASQNFFRLLGVDRGAEPREVANAYHRLADRWDPELYSESEPDRARVGELRERLDEGCRTLMTPERRAAYEVYLERRARGLTTDVGAIARAEQLYDEAMRACQREDWTSALRLVERSLVIDEDPVVRSARAWLCFKLDRASVAEAIRQIEAGLAEEPWQPEACFYLAELCEARGASEDARGWLAKGKDLLSR